MDFAENLKRHSTNSDNNVLNFFKTDRMTGIEPDRRRISVLIVDDDEVDFFIIKRSLSQMQAYDADIHYASDIETAREIAATQPIDLALVDYCLGTETGVRAIEEIGGRGGQIPIIMVSGMPGTEVPQIALKAGAINHINKNEVSPVLFDSMIRSALYTHRLESQLRDTIYELNKADRAKDNFFSRMSHDLKTPLNAILGYTEALQQGVYDEGKGQEKALENIDQAGHLLVDTINDLIMRASNNEALDEPTFKPEAVSEILANAINFIEPFAISSGHELNVKGLESEAIIECDADRLMQALTNLLSNAIKYTQEPGQVILSVKETDDDIEIQIKDNGIGMSHEQLKTALAKHGRVKQTGSFQKEGTGIGLSIVQEIIKQHNGDMICKTAPHEGTAFLVRLPKVHMN